MPPPRGARPMNREDFKKNPISKGLVKKLMSYTTGKYKALQDVADVLLSEKKAERMADEEKRTNYAKLIQNRNQKKENLQNLDNEYNELINYANEHRDEYDQLQEGHTADEVTQAQITKLNEALKAYYNAEKKYVQDANSLVADLEINVLYPKIAKEKIKLKN